MPDIELAVGGSLAEAVGQQFDALWAQIDVVAVTTLIVLVAGDPQRGLMTAAR